MNTLEKLKELRNLMEEKNITAYLVTTSDFHNSEYSGDYFKTREYICPFSGSSGTVIVTLTEAFLWTDGRYFLQAERELLGSTFKLFKSGMTGVPTTLEFIEKNLNSNDKLAFDGRTLSHKTMVDFLNLSNRNLFKIEPSVDLIGDIWRDRPSLSKEKVFLLDDNYSGKPYSEKINDIRKYMIENKFNCHIVSSLDDIAWILNIRGNDISCSPVVLAYLIIFLDKVILFTDKKKFSMDLISIFKNDNIYLENYNSFYNFLKTLDVNSNILLDYSKINSLIFSSLNKKNNISTSINPSTVFKSRKNKIEIKNTKIAHINDGIYIVKFMYWLKNNIGKIDITELDIVNKIDSLRKSDKDFIDLSFETIAATGKNGAVIHYQPSEKTNTKLENKNLILIDSGAHYMTGTTDITRTFALGEVDPLIKKHFTYVLKSLIALSNTKFTSGATGGQLDTIARSKVWEIDLDYRHGTGHGVGHILNVHEGPNSFSPKNNSIIKANTITTIEPGIYIDGSHGIRLENENLAVQYLNNDYGNFIKFEPLTFVPFDLDAIDISYLSLEEKNWLNNYHKTVFEKISPSLNEDEVEFLKKYTRTI